MGSSYSQIFDGIIDELQIYDRALSQSEIQAAMNDDPPQSGLVAEYKFEDKILFGKSTYEFEESTNQYYGLQNWNERWLALFDPTTKTVEYLIFSERPTSLKVMADEDELIDTIEVGLPAGAMAWVGEIVHRDLTADADSDGVPDFIEDYIQAMMPKLGWT